MTIIPACRLGSLGWSESRNELDFMRTAIGQKYEADFSPRVEVVIQVGEAPLSGEASAIFSKMLGKAHSIVDGLEAETIRVKAIIETEQGGLRGKNPQAHD